ncbi:MAG: ABC transporter substrate-binding protein [Eubacteriales bacterium]|nr:ABC transporter substrate-binding protein [Eubacteriales bacterium]
MRKETLKRLCSLILCLVLAIGTVLTTGCAKTAPAENATEPETAAEAPTEPTDDTITVAIDTEPTHLALSVSPDYITVWVTKNINDFLVQYDPEMKLQFSVAKRIDRIDDKTYEFEIRPGVLFHNGREVKADDVKFSLDYIMDPNNGSSTASYFTSLDRVEVTGDYTGVIYLKEPYAPFVSRLSMVPIIPKECADTLKTSPVGCGPFKFKAWNKDQDIELVRFDDYWKEGYPKAAGLTFKFIKEYNTMHNAFLAGEVDILLWSSFTDIAIWDGTEGVHPQATNLFDSFILVYNTQVEPFNNPLVRKAIALALNKQELIDLTSQGYGKVLDQPVYPGTYFYNDAASYTQDIEAAKALLAQAGYPDGFTCSLKVPNTVQEGGCGDVIQAQLKKIGIDCQLEKMEVSVFIDAVWTKKNFEMCVTGDGSEGEPDTWLSRWIKTGAGNNVGSYSNPELDALIAQGAAASTDEARKEAYDKAFLLMRDEQPITFLFGGYLYSALQDNVQGLQGYANWWFDFDGVYKTK